MRRRSQRWRAAGAALIVLGGLLWAEAGEPRWQASAFLHALALAGLAGTGISLLARAGLLGKVRLGDPFGTLAGGSPGGGRIAAPAGAALLLLLCVLLASSLQAEYRAFAFRRLGVWVCMAGWTYLIARASGTPDRLRRMASILGALGAGASLLAILGTGIHGGLAPKLPFHTPNHDGVLAAATLPILAVLWIVDRPRRRVWVVLAAAALIGAALSRSAVAAAALAAGLLTLGLGLIAAWRKGRPDAAAGAAAASLILAALLAPVLMGRSALAERSGMAGAARPLERGEPTYNSDARQHWLRIRALLEGRPDAAMAARLRYARAALGALREEPLLGFGPGSVPLTFARYRLQVPGASSWGEAVGQLHAVGLQRIYESGLAGLAAFAAWVLLSVLGRPAADPLRSWLRAGLAGGAAALAVAGAADALETAPALPAASVALLALLAAQPEARASERRPRLALAAAGMLALLFVLAAGADLLRADLAQRRAEASVRRARSEGIDGAVMDGLRAAARIDRTVGLYQQQAAYAAEELALARARRGDSGAARALFDEAERFHLDLARRFPDVPGFASRAGSFLLDRGRPQEAIRYLLSGLALDYYDPLAQFYLGEAYRLAGREEEAVEAHARAMRYYPRISRAELWRDPGTQALRRRVLGRLRSLLLAESSHPAPGAATTRLLEEIEIWLQKAPAKEGGSVARVVLVRRLDAASGLSRASHLFDRQGFAMENLPVAILEAGGAEEDARWARVLEGLPALTAVEVESRQAASRGKSSEDGSRGARRAGCGKTIFLPSRRDSHV